MFENPVFFNKFVKLFRKEHTQNEKTYITYFYYIL